MNKLQDNVASDEQLTGKSQFELVKDVLELVTAVLALLTAIFELINGKKGEIRGAYVWWWLIILCACIIYLWARRFITSRYYEPQFKDKPLLALRKAKRSDASMAQVSWDGNDAHYFVYREKGNQIWVAPEIRYKWIPEDSEKDELDFKTRLSRDFDSKDSDYAGRLFESVEQAVRDKKIEVQWCSDNDGRSVGPIRKVRSSVHLLDGPLKPIWPEE